MDILKETVEVEVKVSPEKVAELFCSMDADEQAAFFNRIAEDVKTWPSCNFDMQMHYVSEKEALTYEARRIMLTIGNYSQKTN